ncbi:DUF3846 domain-containing protein [Priestia aryabhattai]|uniref:DUF3846 domain-containing protein n=1 Tax=Priestia TaxID=2800373 RepID=UPI001ECD6F4F|nr:MULTISPECIES: DUF3846 domain-containing protein [Priestia]MBY0092602.1 DUF3846 domain-containing protein [Priestia aryabhattai]MBY0103045.1 DUF3846 domain-containing protein [Priestia aryabhattai]MCY9023610.1 DUF3846 domain-containing protein [Priestia megaterium]
MADEYVKEEFITCALLDVGEEPKVVRAVNELDAFQSAVDGDIEVITLTPERNILMVVNAEGKMKKLEDNLSLGNDVVVGNAVIVGCDPEEVEFRSLTNEELQMALDFLHTSKIR